MSEDPHDPTASLTLAAETLGLSAPGTRVGRYVVERQLGAGGMGQPHIGAVYDLLEHDGMPVLAMEFIDGEPLRDTLGRGHMPVGDV